MPDYHRAGKSAICENILDNVTHLFLPRILIAKQGNCLMRQGGDTICAADRRTDADKNPVGSFRFVSVL